MHNKLLALSTLMILISCVPATVADKQSTPGNINANAPYLWYDKSFPKIIRVSLDFDAAELANIEAMSTAWKTAMEDKVTFFAYGSRTSEISGNVNNLDHLYDNVMGIYKTDRWPDSIDSSALAVTQMFGRRYNIGSESEFVDIEHADILINDDVFDFDTTDTGFNYDLRTVLLHEMGHFLGMNHNTSVPRSSTVMYPSIDSTENKRVPQNADIADLATKYNITLGNGSAQAMASASVQSPYQIKSNDAGESVRIIMELRANGECVHKENGRITGRHQLKR